MRCVSGVACALGRQPETSSAVIRLSTAPPAKASGDGVSNTVSVGSRQAALRLVMSAVGSLLTFQRSAFCPPRACTYCVRRWTKCGYATECGELCFLTNLYRLRRTEGPARGRALRPTTGPASVSQSFPCEPAAPFQLDLRSSGLRLRSVAPAHLAEGFPASATRRPGCCRRARATHRLAIDAARDRSTRSSTRSEGRCCRPTS